MCFVLGNFQGCFDNLSSFLGGYFVPFLAISRAVSIYLVGFFVCVCVCVFVCFFVVFFRVYSVPFLAICRVVLIYLVLISGLFKGLSVFSDSVDFSFSKG